MITEELSTTDDVWKHFSRLSDGLKAKCSICQISLPLVNNSTTGLQSHLQWAHKIILIEQVAPKIEDKDIKLEAVEEKKPAKPRIVNNKPFKIKTNVIRYHKEDFFPL